jgi:hypothetical protein
MKPIIIEDGIIFPPDDQPKTDAGNQNVAPLIPKPTATPKPDNRPAAAPSAPNQGSNAGSKEIQNGKLE